MIRGIEHIGITVADLAQAEQFLVAAFDASVLYRLVPPDRADEKVGGETMSPLNGFPPEMQVTGLSMLRLANGCNVELFQTQPAAQDRVATPAQPGINHFSLYVEDIHRAGEKMIAQGATMFAGPNACFAQEAGAGNQTWFGLTPFGVLIELISLPSPLQYDSEARAQRWIPADG